MSIQQGKIMKRKSAITFIVELLALFALLITVITVIFTRMPVSYYLWGAGVLTIVLSLLF